MDEVQPLFVGICSGTNIPVFLRRCRILSRHSSSHQLASNHIQAELRLRHDVLKASSRNPSVSLVTSQVPGVRFSEKKNI